MLYRMPEPEQAKRDRSVDRQANAWLRARLARDPELVQSVFAKFPVVTDDTDRQRREDAGYKSDVLALYRTPRGSQSAVAPNPNDEAPDASKPVEGVQPWHSHWHPTATPAKIQQRKNRLSDVDVLRAFLADGPKPYTEVRTLMPRNRLLRAKAKLGVKSRKVGFGAGSYVVWELS